MISCCQALLAVLSLLGGIIVELRLKEIRESQFLTQRELAAKSGLGLATVVRVEKGQQRPTFRTIKRLAAALGINPKELVVRDVSGVSELP